MIPKIIHCVWFGGKPMPEKEKMCIESWEKMMPDYEIMIWNETNFDVNKVRYVKEAYVLKKYAFVSDYVRLWALYNYGGIYLDTDVEVIKPLDDLLSKTVFCEFETTMVAVAICGAERKNAWIKELLDEYHDRKFLLPIGALNTVTNLRYVTNSCERHGLIRDGKHQILDNGLEVFENDYFLPTYHENGKADLTENTYTIHHYSGSWTAKKNTLFSRICYRIKYGSMYWIFYKLIFQKKI